MDTASATGSPWGAVKATDQDKETLPYPPGNWLGMGSWLKIPFIGETLELKCSLFSFTENRVQKYGNVARANILFRNICLLSGAEGMKTFYNEQLVQRSGGFPSQYKLITGGKNFLIMEDDDNLHGVRRAILMNGIQDRSMLDSYVPRILHAINRMFDEWNLRSTTEYPIVADLHLMGALIGSNIILGTGISDRKTGEWVRDRSSEIFNALQAWVPIPIPYITAAGRGFAARREFLQFINQIIKHPNASPVQESDSALHAMLRDPRFCEFDDMDVVIMLSIMAACGLVGNALTDMVMSFSRYPGVWNRVKDEVRDKIGMRQSDPVTLEQLDQLDYLQATVDEVRRLYPFSAGTWGVVKEPFVLDGYYVPRGWATLGCFYTTNHDPSEWSDPYHFKPERFLDSKEPRSGKQWAWMAHGSQHHKCSGAELTTLIMKLFAVQLVRRNSSWEVVSPQSFDFDWSLFIPEPRSSVRIRNFCSR